MIRHRIVARNAVATGCFFALPLLASTLPSCSCQSDAETLAAAGSGAGGFSATSATTTSAATSTTGQGGGGAPPLPGGVPDGWVQLPGSWPGCEVYVSPDAAHLRPASPWSDCGNGCLELVDDWSSDPKNRMFGTMGASTGDTGFLGYYRYLEGGSWEIQIVRLPENIVMFDLIRLGDIADTACVTHLSAISPAGALLDTFQAKNVSSGEGHFAAHVMRPDTPLPALSYSLDTLFSLAPHLSAISEDLWIGTGNYYSLGFHSWPYSESFSTAWTSPDGRSLGAPSAVGETAFFDTWRGDLPTEILVWDALNGARPLVGSASKVAGGACGLTTDGVTMAWLQATGYQGGEVYSDVSWMVAPFTSDPAALQPKVLRKAYQNHVQTGGGMLAGGYLFRAEARIGGGGKVLLTRLSDGAEWTIPDPPGFVWTRIAYVTKSEIALEMNATVDNPDAGTSEVSVWSVRRLAIDSLGEADLPP